MKILNPGTSGDYHIHSSTFSDGFNSIDEIVIQAGILGLKEIAITDHCQSLLDAYGLIRKTHYDIIRSGRWSNVHNNVHVIFGVEADILNEDGYISDDIQGIKPEFVILSSHKKVYQGDPSKIKTAYLNSIKRFGNRINFLGHLASRQFSDYLTPEDIREILLAANDAGISCELNCANLIHNKTDIKNLEVLLHCCNSLYVNSDAHTLYEFINGRNAGFEFIKKQQL